MSAPETPVAPSVLGDFVLAFGRDAAAWVRSLTSDGFTVITEPDEAAQAAVRGRVQTGRSTDGRGDGARWMALADLVEGKLDDGPRALSPSGTPPQRAWRGRFAQVAWSAADQVAVALTDHFSTLSLYALVRDDLLVVGTDLRTVGASPVCKRALDLESVYHYLNFAVVPAPKTIYRDVTRLEPGTRLQWSHRAGASSGRYYVPEYPEDLRGSDSTLAAELRERMVATVQAYQPELASGWGCFLSGGTDSSSIVSMMSRRLGPGRVKSFSIGFAEEGFDELGFARIAARACGADPSFAQVSRADTQALIARVIDGYDQPFGNASAIPTIACADLAKGKGATLLVAGDGGDEIFGGNQRYAKDRVMEAWYAMPGPVKALGRTIGHAVGGGSIHLLNRVENFFERSSLPNPDRFYTDDSFASDHYDTLLKPDFRRAVARDASLDFMRAVYAVGRSGSPLHRIMRLDLMMAIAQNDLRKVHGATRSAGITTRFPYLDPPLVDWVNRLPERYKVRGIDKRYLFKRAMKGILPEEILRKKKQGFGLPIAVWLRSDKAFQESVKETIFDERARARGWWEPAFVERIMDEHVRGAWDHADSIWRIFVLEKWLRRYADAT